MSEIGALLANILSRGIGGYQTGKQINVGQTRQNFLDRLRMAQFEREGDWREQDIDWRETQAEDTADWRNRQAIMDMFQFTHGGAARAQEAQAGRESRERMNQARIDASMQEIIARLDAGGGQLYGGMPASVFNMLGGKAFEQTRFKGEERSFLDILDEYQKAIRYGPNSPFNRNIIVRGLPPDDGWNEKALSEKELRKWAK